MLDWTVRLRKSVAGNTVNAPLKFKKAAPRIDFTMMCSPVGGPVTLPPVEGPRVCGLLTGDDACGRVGVIEIGVRMISRTAANKIDRILDPLRLRKECPSI